MRFKVMLWRQKFPHKIVFETDDEEEAAKKAFDYTRKSKHNHTYYVYDSEFGGDTECLTEKC